MSLAGLKVVEFAGLAPGPFAGLILADHGADVVRIDRPGVPSSDILCRGKRSLAVNSKTPSGRNLLRKLITQSDVLIDPFRPGVLERLGLGPKVFLGSEGKQGLNERLVYARIAGFPRTGPHKDMAGHDINYLALSGVLSLMPRTPDVPSFPLNLLADFAGGGASLANGILLAIIERTKSGRGQTVEADMVSGTRYLSSFPLLHKLSPSSQFFSGLNILGGGAPFYAVYACKDGKFMSVGCLEPQFFKVFIELFVQEVSGDRTMLDWSPQDIQANPLGWPKLKQYLKEGFLTKTREGWTKIFHGTDACAVPVLTPEEAALLDASKLPLPVPHPHLTRTPSKTPEIHANITPQMIPGQHNEEVLEELGTSAEEWRRLVNEGAISSKYTVKL
ncbi:CoA-transferase family III [Athelia psychrophila]|uniref:CoA-transferase family III n=1 Tax=Athelia psychrophila TaxID=1759441 RepID=A0A166UGN9_9AGAM|nr:CoA-transferase family III [Fibularhizoctonia sp. CBS 109695]